MAQAINQPTDVQDVPEFTVDVVRVGAGGVLSRQFIGQSEMNASLISQINSATGVSGVGEFVSGGARAWLGLLVEKRAKGSALQGMGLGAAVEGAISAADVVFDRVIGFTGSGE